MNGKIFMDGYKKGKDLELIIHGEGSDSTAMVYMGMDLKDKESVKTLLTRMIDHVDSMIVQDIVSNEDFQHPDYLEEKEAYQKYIAEIGGEHYLALYRTQEQDQAFESLVEYLSIALPDDSEEEERKYINEFHDACERTGFYQGYRYARTHAKPEPNNLTELCAMGESKIAKQLRLLACDDYGAEQLAESIIKSLRK